jgi:hypothetical protein
VSKVLIINGYGTIHRVYCVYWIVCKEQEAILENRGLMARSVFALNMRHFKPYEKTNERLRNRQTSILRRIEDTPCHYFQQNVQEILALSPKRIISKPSENKHEFNSISSQETARWHALSVNMLTSRSWSAVSTLRREAQKK